MARTKSFIQIVEQMERIKSYFPEYMDNATFEKSRLKKAYDIMDKYITNISLFQWNRDKYAQAWAVRGNEQFPPSIYSFSNLYKYELS